jgi:excisionase family DNA binding protein
MSNQNRPFTPDQLAERWGCCAETIRQMAKQGRIDSFRLGKMFRIPHAAVEKYEECKKTSSLSEGCAVDTASVGTSLTVSGHAISYRHALARKPKLKH